MKKSFSTLGLIGLCCALPALAGTPAGPALMDAKVINSGDTAWMLVSTALVLFMTIPGLALFYGGMDGLGLMFHSCYGKMPGKNRERVYQNLKLGI